MEETPVTDLIQSAVAGFILDRRARRLSLNTIDYYTRELSYLVAYLNQHNVTRMVEVTADALRGYILELAGHRNPGGVHAAWRAIKAWARWFEEESEGAWRSPMRKIQAPKVSADPLPGINMADFHRLVDACDTSLLGLRDRAILLTLLDTGVRRAELCALSMVDLNNVTGAIEVQHGKGNRRRTVYIGAVTRRAIARYQRKRGQAETNAALFATRAGGRMSYKGLEQMVKNRAHRALVEPPPGLHDFRRAFALTCLKNGMDVYTLMRLMGHSSLHILMRYLHLTNASTADAFSVHGPVDHL